MSMPGPKGYVQMQEPSSISQTNTVVEAVTTPSAPQTRFADIEGLPPSGAPFINEVERPQPVRREGTLDPGAVPPVIPPDHAHRTLILAFDGTGDQFDADNSNVVQLVSLLKKNDRTKQLIYYQAGIGTYSSSPSIATPIISRIRKTLDEMIASSLHAHVIAGYEFLMQNYIAGDKICIFGFSRGAYTARSLAGMLHKVGLLPSGNFQQVPFAYKMYKRTDDLGWEQSNDFKKTFSVDVSIEFIGVWDTVDSVGLIPKRLPFTTSNTIVRTFRHAVALDERRSKFKANLWNRPNDDEAKLGVQADTAQLPRPTSFDEPVHNNKNGKRSPNGLSGIMDATNLFDGKKSRRKEDQDDKKLNTLERLYSEMGEKVTDIEEVWFAGCHCDIGGGAVSNKTRHSLARIALRWMVRECFKTNTGIMFKSDALREIGLDPTTLYPYIAPRPPLLPLADHRIQNPPAVPIPIRPHMFLKKKKVDPEVQKILAEAKIPFLGTEEEEELRDAMSPKYDQLKIKKSWWLLEILPMRLRYQRGDNQWVSYVGSNMAAPRFIPKQRTNGFKVHRSVKMRMEAEYEDEKRRAKGKKYVPKPVFKVEPTWID